MKQLLILSGKGGTGKTTVASAFIKLAQAKTYADCDVDAPNLHLITRHDSVPARKDYYGLPKAQIDPELCIKCDLCRQHCQFGAISVNDTYSVDQFACEGCAVCDLVCPVGAVTLVPTVYGELMLYKEEDKIFSTAQLKMGSGMSGMLVAEVKKAMKDAAVHKKSAIIDGSPGIGCPVIASLSGVDTVLVVTEPSLSGISDMERVIDTALKFGTKVAVCVNKADTNPEITGQIERFCEKQALRFVGRIPYDSEAINAINKGQSIVEIDCPSGEAVRDVYKRTMALLFDEEGETEQ